MAKAKKWQGVGTAQDQIEFGPGPSLGVGRRLEQAEPKVEKSGCLLELTPCEGPMAVVEERWPVWSHVSETIGVRRGTHVANNAKQEWLGPAVAHSVESVADPRLRECRMALVSGSPNFVKEMCSALKDAEV